MDTLCLQRCVHQTMESQALRHPINQCWSDMQSSVCRPVARWDVWAFVVGGTLILTLLKFHMLVFDVLKKTACDSLLVCCEKSQRWRDTQKKEIVAGASKETPFFAGTALGCLKAGPTACFVFSFQQRVVRGGSSGVVRVSVHTR